MATEFELALLAADAARALFRKRKPKPKRLKGGRAGVGPQSLMRGPSARKPGTGRRLGGQRMNPPVLPPMGGSLIRQAPSSRATVNRTGRPSANRRAGLVITHREYVQNIYSSEAFTTEDLRINAGNPRCFPWLGNVARNYEYYKVLKCTLTYEPAAASTTTGTVCICPEYNPSDDAPTSMDKAFSYQGTVSGVPWTAFACPLDMRNVRQGRDFKFVSSETLADVNQAGLSGRDTGVFYICVGDCAAANDGELLGRMVMDYSVELKTPQPSNALGGNIKCQTGVTKVLFMGSADPSGSGDAVDPSNWNGELSLIPRNISGDWEFVWPVGGEFLVIQNVVGVALTAITPATEGDWNHVLENTNGALTHHAEVSTVVVEAGDVFDPVMAGATSVSDFTLFILPATVSEYTAY